MTSTEIRDMLLERHDYYGECDRCHYEAPLWRDLETEGCGDFEYCAPCWRSIAAKQSAPRPSAPVQWHRQKQLLTGLDCAAGQTDLFSTDGSN